MLDIGFSELLLIAVAALVFVGPKDLPVVVKHVARFMRDLRGFYTGIRKQMLQLADEAGLNDLQNDMTTIIDLEGKPQVAYDVRGLKNLKMNSSGEAGSHSPLEGESNRFFNDSVGGNSVAKNPPTETPKSVSTPPQGGSREQAALSSLKTSLADKP